MKPATHTVNELFERDVRYVVPLFQRPYVWDEERQWEPLWEDIQTLLDHEGEPSTSLSHFLGAIVLEQETTAPRTIPVFTVIDGQQRLTTLQLLVAATAEAVREAGAEDDAALLEELVRNNPRKADGEELFKVWPTNANRAAFQAVMRPGGPPADREDDPHNRIDEAYAYFRRRASDWLKGEDLDSPGPPEDRARHLRVTLVDLLKLVSITLEPGDNAQVIFETLNARGTPLLALDLVKNAVFHAAARQGEDAEALYESRWRPELDSDYWRTARRQGRLNRPAGELFLMHWLGMKLQRVVPATELFATFRRGIIEPRGSEPVKPLIHELCRDARILRGFDELPAETLEGRFFRRLEALDTGTLLPLALLLFREAGIDPVRRRRALAAIESWLVRRALMRLTAQAYNREIPRLLTKVAGDPDRADEVVVEHLRDAAGQASRWPTDDELGSFLASTGVYGLVAQKRLVMVLAAVEEALSRPLSEVDVPLGLSVEHILPQSWRTHWPLPDGGDEAEAVSERGRRLHLIGNLTLTTLPLNAALSNSDWPSKQKALNQHSKLLLNVDLVDRFGAGFDEEAIDRRTQWLSAAICRIWPGPDDPQWESADDIRAVSLDRASTRRESLPSATAEGPMPDDQPVGPVDAYARQSMADASTASIPVEAARRMVRLCHEGRRLRGKALSDAVGVPSGWPAFLAMLAAEPHVYPHIRLAQTAEDIVAAREGRLPRSRLIEGEEPTLRWERIAARAGMTTTDVREVYDSVRGPGAARRHYTGRGRRFPGME
jgi:hypothetical protein